MSYVLIADDELDLAELLAEFLEMSEIPAKVANTIQNAMEKISDEEPAILVTDVSIPIGGADVLLRFMKEENIQSKIFLITGDLSTSTRLVRRYKIDEVFEKPVKVKEFVDVIKSAWWKK